MFFFLSSSPFIRYSLFLLALLYLDSLDDNLTKLKSTLAPMSDPLSLYLPVGRISGILKMA